MVPTRTDLSIRQVHRSRDTSHFVRDVQGLKFFQGAAFGKGIIIKSNQPVSFRQFFCRVLESLVEPPGATLGCRAGNDV